jgi:hypothetical protein
MPQPSLPHRGLLPLLEEHQRAERDANGILALQQMQPQGQCDRQTAQQE